MNVDSTQSRRFQARCAGRPSCSAIAPSTGVRPRKRSSPADFAGVEVKRRAPNRPSVGRLIMLSDVMGKSYHLAACPKRERYHLSSVCGMKVIYVS